MTVKLLLDVEDTIWKKAKVIKNHKGFRSMNDYIILLVIEDIRRFQGLSKQQLEEAELITEEKR